MIPSKSKQAKGEMTLYEHLRELRVRLIKILAALGVSSIFCYYFVSDILAWMIAPAGRLFYLSPAEAFFTYCKVALIGGMVISIPVTLYQFWAFLIPALTDKEMAIGVFLIPASVALFYCGLAFSHFLVIPAAVNFFMGFSSESLQAMFSLGQYVSFVLSLLFPFGLVFELPLVILVLAYFGVVSMELLRRYRKHMIVISFVIGGVVSPTPDIFGQTMLALPIIILYELSILITGFLPVKQADSRG